MIFHWAVDKEQAFCLGNSLPALLLADTHGSQPGDAGLDDRCIYIDHRAQGNPAKLRIPVSGNNSTLKITSAAMRRTCYSSRMVFDREDLEDKEQHKL